MTERGEHQPKNLLRDSSKAPRLVKYATLISAPFLVFAACGGSSNGESTAVVDPTEKPTADNMDPTLIPTFDLEGTFGEDACISITPLGVDVDIRVEGIIPTCVPELTATPEPIID